MLVTKLAAAHNYKWYTNQKELDAVFLEVDQIVSPFSGSAPG